LLSIKDTDRPINSNSNSLSNSCSTSTSIDNDDDNNSNNNAGFRMCTRSRSNQNLNSHPGRYGNGEDKNKDKDNDNDNESDAVASTANAAVKSNTGTNIRHTIIFSSDDGIIPIEQVKKYLEIKKEQFVNEGRDCFEMYTFNGVHGEMLIWPSLNSIVSNRIVQRYEVPFDQ
jgi:hypothetical protein